MASNYYTKAAQKSLEAPLLDVGNKLANPPSSNIELFKLVTRAENLLVNVCQSPNSSMEVAIRPAMQALIADKIFKHADLHIQVAVASCLNEMIRLGAPEYPYTDEQMKEIFQLFMVALKQLSRECPINVFRAERILKTLAEVKTCLIVLDIELDPMAVEIFQLFLDCIDSIRSTRSSDVFEDMKTIMTLIIKENEEISAELVKPLLSSVKMESKNTSPRSWELGKSVFENCATEVQNHVREAVKAMNLSVNDYAEIVSSLCQETSTGEDTVVSEEVAPEEVARANEEVTPEEVPSVQVAIEKYAAEEVANFQVANEEVTPEEVPRQVALEEDVTIQLVTTDASCTKLKVTSQAAPETQTQVQRGRRGIKANSLMRPDEGYQHNWLAVVSDSLRVCYHGDKKEDPLLPSDLGNAEMPSGSSKKEIDSVSKVSTGNGDQTKKQESMVTQDNAKDVTSKKKGFYKSKKRSKGVIVGSSMGGGIEMEQVNHRIHGSKRKDENEGTSRGHESGDEHKVVESHISKSSKTNKFKVKEKRSIIQKKTKVVGSIAQKEHSASHVDGKEEIEIAVTRHESENVVDQVTEPPISKPAKTKQYNVKDKGSKKRKKGKLGHSAACLEGKNENETISQVQDSADVVDKLLESQQAKHSGDLDPEKEKEPMEFRLEYGRELVNLRIMVWWPLDQTYYTGTVESFDPATRKHKIKYDDDDEEVLDMSEEKWELFTEIESQKAHSPREGEADPPLVEEPSKTQKKIAKGKAVASRKENAGSSSTSSKDEGGSFVKSGDSAPESIPVKDEADDEVGEANFTDEKKGRTQKKTAKRKLSSSKKEHAGLSSERSKSEGGSIIVKSGRSALESIPVMDKSDDETHEENSSEEKKGKTHKKTRKRKEGPSTKEHAGSSPKRSKSEGGSIVKSSLSEPESISMTDESDDEIHEANFSWKEKALSRAGKKGLTTLNRNWKPSHGAPDGAKIG